MGDQPTGIYLISNGSFEVQIPKNMRKKAQELTENFTGIDAGVKHQILRKTNVQ